MKIHGLQKMTLLDFPGHVACTVFLGGCDLRCPYCHNYELATGPAPPIMEEEELFSFCCFFLFCPLFHYWHLPVLPVSINII